MIQRTLTVVGTALLSIGLLSVVPAGAELAPPGWAADAGVTASPTSADEPGVEAPGCDVELPDIELVNLDHDHAGPDGTTVRFDHRVSPIVALANPLTAGRVLTSGITVDIDHLEDQLDFSTELSQFEEQVIVRFFDASGELIAETDPTPDLPDITPYAPFALPSIDLDRPATAIQIVHAAVGTQLNSLAVPCLDFAVVDADSQPADHLTWTLCPVDGQAPPPAGAACGFLSVPENRDDPGSRLISIAFAIVFGERNEADPVVYLEGGPGGAPVANAGIIFDLAMGAASGGRDVIFVDQRGTGYAQPNLNCLRQQDYATEPTTFDTFEEFEAAQLALLDTCHERLVGDGIDLDGYTTVQNAADLADLRLALGYDEWNLFGGSYGTDLALSIMRDAPAGVRSVVLDSVFPPEVNVTAGEDAIGFLNRLDYIADICTDDPVCAAAYPDVRADLIAAVDHLNEQPIPVSGTHIEFLFGVPEGELDGFTLLGGISGDIANPYLPAALHALADDDPGVRSDAADDFLRATTLLLLGLPVDLLDAVPVESEAPPLENEQGDGIEGPVAAAVARGVPGPGLEFSDGFFFTVMCAEEFPFDTGATDYLGGEWSEAIYLYALSLVDQFDFAEECAIFDLAPEDPIVNEPVVSDLPTLVLYTDTDYQTPPEWSELTAARLPNSDLVFFPNLGHVVVFYSSCPQSVMAQFLDDPGGELDTSCVGELVPIFYADTLPDVPPLPPIDLLFSLLEPTEPLIEDVPVEETVTESEAPPAELPPGGDEGAPTVEAPLEDPVAPAR